MGLQEKFDRNNAWEGRPIGAIGLKEGIDAERAILGVATGESSDEFMPFTEAIDDTKERQPLPFGRSKLIKNLREKIAGKCNNKGIPVKFFTAVGTPLDIHHGVDAFFEHGRERVTLDLTLREKNSSKADIILYASLDGDGEVHIEPYEMERVAIAAAAILND
ncbi:MAG: hypothetical protein JKY22_00400 [Flavobacteriaceae bacterium]|nr:hypothetical protein [Flavobacteriaceae bacterium]PCI29060.1 MAG: hypothetical protein COB52_02940 [Candidatus Kaiserbacteria bacterium]